MTDKKEKVQTSSSKNNNNLCLCLLEANVSHPVSVRRESIDTNLVAPVTITKTYLYNFDPLKPHFYIVKLGFIGVYIIFLISARKHRLWVLVRTASLSRHMKTIEIFYVKIFIFWC